MGKDWNEQLIKAEIREIAHKVQQVLNKYGEASLKDDSVTFEGNKLIFSSDDKSMNIYSKSREQVIFEVNPSENRVFYEPNLSEKQILERLKYNPALQQQQRRNAPRR